MASKKSNFKIELKFEFPFSSSVEACNKKEALELAMDNAMDYFERQLSDSHKFDEFWEYKIKPKVIAVIKEENKGS